MNAVVKMEVEKSQTVVTQSETTAIIHMIERAARDPSVDIDKMERLLAMQERVMARQAESAYAAALAEMQPDLPVIGRRGKIDIGRGKPQQYALWEDINEGIKPILARHGFALSFRTGRDGDKITVTGILSHREGHREETTLLLPIDGSGSKNAVQAVGSSTSYGKRYTASALLNLTSRGEDDDGKAAETGELIMDDQIASLAKMIEDTGSNLALFLKHFKIASLSDMPVSRFRDAVAALAKKKAKAS